MKLYQKSLVSLLKRTGLPVYTTGQVPAGAVFPYITLTTAYAPFAQSAGITVTAWFRGEHAHLRCVELMDALCAIVPEKGTLLRYTGGIAMLRRAAGSFITLVSDEYDHSILGGRMRLNAHLYDA